MADGDDRALAESEFAHHCNLTLQSLVKVMKLLVKAKITVRSNQTIRMNLSHSHPHQLIAVSLQEILL